MPDLPNRDPGNLEDRRKQTEQPSSLLRYASWLAALTPIAAGIHIYGKKKGYNVIAELLNLTGRAPEYLGNLGGDKRTEPVRGALRERIRKTIDMSVDGGGAVLGKGDTGGLRLDEIDSIRDQIDAIQALSDPTNYANRAEMEEKFVKFFSKMPKAGPADDSFFHHNLEQITFGDVIARNNEFVSGGASTTWKSGESLELNSIRHAIKKNWITADTIIDANLFWGKSGATKKVIDTRVLRPKYALNQLGKAISFFGVVDTAASMFGNSRNISVIKRANKWTKEGIEESVGHDLFVGGDVFKMGPKGLVHTAKGQRLGKVKDALHLPSRLREARFSPKIKGRRSKLDDMYDPVVAGRVEQFTGLPLAALEAKTGIGRSFQDKPGGPLRTMWSFLKGSHAVANNKAQYVGNVFRTNQRIDRAILGNEVILPEAAELSGAALRSQFHLQALDQKPLTLRAGDPYTKWVDGKPVEATLSTRQAFMHRVKAEAGVNPDVHIAHPFVPGSEARKPFHRLKRGGISSLEDTVGVSPEMQGVTQTGLADHTVRNRNYFTSGSKIDRAYDAANYMAIRLNTLASSSLLGIGYRPSGNLGANVARMAAIPAIYMAGAEAIKYGDYTIGQITGVRPLHVLAGAYTKLREAQQFARNNLGISAAASYIEEKALPGVNVGLLGTLGAAVAGIAALRTTGSIRKSLKAAGLVYGIAGGPNVGQSVQSLRDVYAGDEKVAVRQARWWSMGYQPFAGGRISHYAPSWYTRMKKQPYKTNIYGSEAEYWAHGTALPTFQNWFHARTILNPYATEYRNYRKRPYPVSGGLGEEIPIIGPLFADTIGAIIKPRIDMHKGETFAPAAQSMINTRGVAYGAAARLGMPGAPVARLEGADPRQTSNRLAKYANVGLEPTGIWKFALQFFGVDFGKDRVAADSGNMGSSTRGYYEQAFGGLGGETEFMRRFILSDYGKASKINSQINPIPNTMPRWLPGSLSENQGDRNSAYDMSRGDAYTKMAGGEFRLPGEGYESVNELHGEKYKDFNNVKYKATVTRVIDADTIGVSLGGREQKIRFADIQAPEISTPEGKMLANYLARILSPGTEVNIESKEDAWGSKNHFGHFGRAIGTVSLGKVNINEMLASTGWVKSVNQKYDAVDKFLILSDVAPFSEGYYKYLNQVQSMELDPKWQRRVERAIANRGSRLDIYGFGKHSQETVAALNLDPITSSIRKGWMGLRDNVLSEIPIVGSKVFPKTDPAEHYRKFRVEGDNFANWNKPWETIARPALYDVVGDNPLLGAAKGGALAMLLAASPFKMFVPFTPISAMAAAAVPKFVGASALLGGGVASARALATGQLSGGFVPMHVKQERDFDEYSDMLMYKKYSTLTNLATMKGDDVTANMFRRQAQRTRIGGLEELERTGESALYSSSLSATDRAYFEAFVQEPQHKRTKILSVVPEHMKNALSSIYGRSSSHRNAATQVEEYFQDHFLPDPGWGGWSPDIPADAVKIRAIQQGFGFMSDSEHRFDFYPAQAEEAKKRYHYLDDFPFSTKSKGHDTDDWLNAVFNNNAFSRLDFGIGNTNSVNMNLIDNKNSEIYYYHNDLRAF
jgi:endonuclease YncB( thermonuclease family)